MVRELLRRARRFLGQAMDLKGGIMLAMPIREACTAGHWDSRLTVQRLTEFHAGLPVQETELLSRLQQGHKLHVLEDAGRILSHGWVSGAGCTVLVLHDMRFTVPASSIYVWDCHTAPEERNRGHFQRLLAGILDSYPNTEVAYVAVDVRNAASRRALQRTGFRPVFQYFGLRLFRHPVIGLARVGRRLFRGQVAFDRIGERKCGTPSSACW